MLNSKKTSGNGNGSKKKTTPIVKSASTITRVTSSPNMKSSNTINNMTTSYSKSGDTLRVAYPAKVSPSGAKSQLTKVTVAKKKKI